MIKLAKTFNATGLSESQIEKLLEDEDIQYLKYIASGEYADAFETAYEGKRVIVKVTKFQKDFDNYVKMDNVKRSLPPDQSRFLPEIFFLKVSEVDGKRFFLIGVEPLLPLDPSVKKNMFEFSKTHHNYFSVDLDILTKEFRTKQLIRRESGGPQVAKFFDKNIKQKDSVLKQIIKNYVDRKKLINTDLEPDDEAYLLSSLTGMLNQMFLRQFNKHKMGRDLKSMKDYEDSIPETQSLSKFCKFLYNNFGVEAQDIHPGNIMMRPNGDLVISDVGNFIIKSAAKPKLEEKYYQYSDPEFRRAPDLDNEIEKEQSRQRIATEIFKRYNLPLVKELASGSFSSAYESVFGGKRVCVKVTQSDSDFEAYQAVQRIAASLGKDKRFLPKIYKTIELDNYYVIISELLKPLDPNVKANLFSLFDSTFNKKNLTFAVCLDILHGEYAKTKTKMAPEVSDVFQRKLELASTYLLVLAKRYRKIPTEVLNVVYDKFLSVLESYDRDVLKSNQYAPAFFRYLMVGGLANLQDNYSFAEEDFGQIAPEKKQFIEFLKKLEKLHGLSLGDLHGQNIMMRDNGEIVVADVGIIDGM